MPSLAKLRDNAAVINELFPTSQPAEDTDRVADKLESQLTSAFEAALEEGMSETAALALMLSWMSGEVVRIR